MRLTQTELAQLYEIQDLLDAAYDHYFEHGDGHCKSSEGYVEVRFPNYFERRDGFTTVSVGVYSYVLGPSRMHHFGTIQEALDTVREWHRKEMEHDYSKDWGLW